MGWKEALKPNSQKITLFFIFVLFSGLGVAFDTLSIYEETLICKVIGLCAPPNVWGYVGPLIGAAPAIIIVSYLIAAMFVHEEHVDKPKKKKVTKKSKKTVKKKTIKKSPIKKSRVIKRKIVKKKKR